MLKGRTLTWLRPGAAQLLSKLVLTSGRAGRLCKRPSHGASRPTTLTALAGSNRPYVSLGLDEPGVGLRQHCRGEPLAAQDVERLMQRTNTPLAPSNATPPYRDEAISEPPSWAMVGPPDILLMVLAALSLWALIVWAISRYL